MSRQIFINLPVKDLNASISFFKSLGFEFDPKFTDETAACMIISEDIHAMLLTHGKFKSFIDTRICDAHMSTEVLLCLSCESREEVDKMVRRAVAAGGSAHQEPKDHGLMAIHGFRDLDGHIWEVMHMAYEPTEEELANAAPN